jgi:hypothetical protein
MLFARIGIVRALEAHAERTLHPERQGSGPSPSQVPSQVPSQDNLKCDRDASI